MWAMCTTLKETYPVESFMSCRYIAKSVVSTSALLVAIGIATPSPAMARDIFAPRPPQPQIIGLQIAQEKEPALAQRLEDAASAAEADVPALAPQSNEATRARK